jgi:hypothetical protein
MVKLVAVGAVVCAVVYLLAGRGGEADARDCLKDAGATVTKSTLFRDLVGDHPLSRNGDEHTVDVQLAEASAVVVFAGDEQTAAEMAGLFSYAGPYSVERVKDNVVAWTDEPSPATASKIRDCVD